MIQPYQYMHTKQIVAELINVYLSVNDAQTVATVQMMTAEQLKDILPEPEANQVAGFLLDKHATRATAQDFFDQFKEQVEPFQVPTAKQIEKVFRKVKKLHLPDFEQIDLREQTFLGWNDPGTQRKYLLYYDQEGRLQGVYGSLAPTTVKNICAICHKESAVAMFLATTKTSGDGTYTKKGNYICADSEKCNRQLHSHAEFEQFVTHLK